MLLIHGARAALLHERRAKHPDRLRAWALEGQRLCGRDTATVALADKMARIVWAVWCHERPYRSEPAEERS